MLFIKYRFLPTLLWTLCSACANKHLVPQIDLRYTSKEMGEIAVVVAPVLRFADIGFNANVKIEDLGDPKKIIQGFGPELYGKPVDDEMIYELNSGKNGDLTYYYGESPCTRGCVCTVMQAATECDAGSN